MFKAVCYVSNISKGNSIELDQLFKLTKENNIKLDITGVLIYKNGNFLQIIEGEDNKVYSLYDKICIDKRHHHIIKVLDINIPGRIFEDYETGFSIINSSKQFKQLEEYLSWIKQSETKCAIKAVNF